MRPKRWSTLVVAALLCGGWASDFAGAQEQGAALPVTVVMAATVEATDTSLSNADGLPDAPVPVDTQTTAATPAQKAAAAEKYGEGQQTKRILFIIPNFRAVSVDAKLPALSKKEKLKLAVSDSFDYSSFIYVGMVAGTQMANDSTVEFHQGAAGYGRYYWHAFVDNTDGNMQTEAFFPILTHEDPRYYTLGRGGFAKRLGYSLGRLFVTRTDQDKRTFNVSEIAGNAVGATISNFYYPQQERTAKKTIENWWLQISLDGASNVMKEFWPDVAHKMFHENVEIETK